MSEHNSLEELDRRLEELARAHATLNDRVITLTEYVEQLAGAMNQNGRSFQDLAKEFNRLTTYFNLLVGMLAHNGTIDEAQFKAAQGRLDREVMNQLLKNNLTETEDGQ